MKFGKKKRTPRGVPEDEPVNHLRRAILETLTVLIWIVLIVGSLVNTGKVTETLVMSCIIPVIFAMNAVKDFKTHKEDKAAEKAAKEDKKRRGCLSILFFSCCFSIPPVRRWRTTSLYTREALADSSTGNFEMILLQIKADERRCTEGTSSEDSEDMEQKGLKTYRGIIWSHRKADDRRRTEGTSREDNAAVGRKNPRYHMRACAAVRTFFISITRVMGPTPPGTGVMKDAFSATSL